MSTMVIKNGNGLVLASDHVSGTLWSLGGDGHLRNVNVMDIQASDDGQPAIVELYDASGALRFDGRIRSAAVRRDDTIVMRPYDCVLELYPKRP